MVQRKSNGGQINASGERPVEFWEVRFREISDGVRLNRDELREIKWATQAQGKSLNELAQTVQQLLARRRSTS